jgi:hypothetical protein
MVRRAAASRTKKRRAVGAGEGAAQGVQQGAGRPGQLVVQAAQLASDGAGLARLPPPSFASLGLGQSPLLAYAGHHSLFVRSTGGVLFP